MLIPFFGVALLEHVQAAAEVRKIEIKSLAIRESDQLEADFVSLEAWKPDALLMRPALPQKQIAILALNRRLPAVSPTSAFCEAGGLASLLGRHRSVGWPVRDIRRQNPEGQKAVGTAGRIANRIPAKGQSQDGSNDWIEHSSHAARPRRRGDRIKCLIAACMSRLMARHVILVRGRIGSLSGHSGHP